MIRKPIHADGVRACAIDFGASNSAVAIAVRSREGDPITRVDLAPLENGATSMPTAVFYSADDGSRHFGRAAVAAYVDGLEGRLMRSIKCILGSDLMDEATELPSGLQVRYLDVVVAYLRHLMERADEHWRTPLDRVVIGRPVFFVDDDPQRDSRAWDTLLRAARAAGISEVQFRFEPVAAALDFTGGSTGLRTLVVRLAAAFPLAQAVSGDRYASVVSGLAITAQRRFAR